MSHAFDRLMAELDPPMVVLTAAADGERAGCLVGFHAQCSIDPAQYAIWVSKANHTHAIAIRAEHLAVHVLGSGDHDLAERFGGLTGDEVDKFDGCAVLDGPGGLPLLARVGHRIVGRRVATVDVDGDHSCVVIEPIDVRADGDMAPLRLHDAVDIEPGHAADDAG